MFFCEDCGRDHTNVTCPRCGKANSHRRPHQDEGPVSVDEGSLDTMIEQASRPTLASLLKRGIDSGLIKPSHDYATGSTP
jgi:predicted amidophosphoribosyltransferase